MFREPRGNFGLKRQNAWLLKTSEERVKVDLLERKTFSLLKLEVWEERKLVKWLFVKPLKVLEGNLTGFSKKTRIKCRDLHLFLTHFGNCSKKWHNEMLFVLRPNKEGHLLYPRNLTKIPPHPPLLPFLKNLWDLIHLCTFILLFRGPTPQKEISNLLKVLPHKIDF